MIRTIPVVSLAAALALSACGGDRELVREANGKPIDALASTASAPDGSAASASADAQQNRRPECDRDNGGITVPDGFCALVVASGLGGVRHMVVAPSGDLYAAVTSRRGTAGGVLALRDTTGDGKADVRERFGDRGGTGIDLQGRWLYFAPDSGVVRWQLSPGRLVPAGQPQTIVWGLPTGGHAAKSIAFDGRGAMFVNIGSRSNSCQQADRQPRSPGVDPCTELATRAGTWRFDANRPDQTFADGRRWATGIRNGLALAWNRPAAALYAVVHGRDQLSASWGFTDQQNAELPSEEMFRLDSGTDGGWPYCYHDRARGSKVLAPEYGGDGRQVGRCRSAEAPLVAFPAHWAPNDLLFYTGTQFPARYRGGAFVAFHGSWNRAPLPQQGYRVAFVPFSGGRPSGEFETFADGFAGGTPQPGTARHRPTGLAEGPDGSLYVSDDAGGTIWRILHRGQARR